MIRPVTLVWLSLATASAGLCLHVSHRVQLLEDALSGINRTYDNSTFDRILINGFAGSDRIILDPFLDKPATIYGDAGDDIILSGAGNDLIYGGSGTDFIYGRGGNDVMRRLKAIRRRAHQQEVSA